MSEPGIVEGLKSSLEARLAHRETEFKKLQAHEEFVQQATERIKSFHGYCGRILYEEGKLEKLTTGVKKNTFYGSRHPSKLEYSYLSPVNRAALRFDSILLSHTKTEVLPVELPIGEEVGFNLGLRVHCFRPIKEVTGTMKWRPDKELPRIEDLSQGLFVVELVAEKDELTTTKQLDISYSAHMNNSLSYSFEGGTIPWSVNENERIHVLEDFDEFNQFLELISTSYQQPVPVAKVK